MRRPSKTSVAAVGTTLLTALGLWAASDLGIQDLPVGRSAQGRTMAVTVVLPTAEGITIGADVRNGQKVVGRVSDMALDTSGAAVQLSVSSDSGLPANAVASVELPSALGNPFIRLTAPEQPSARVLHDGDVIPPSQTELGPQIESALATFGALMSRSGVDQLATIVTELDRAFAGRSDKIRGLVESMSILTGKTREHQDAFDEALALAADISAQFVDQQATVDGYLDTLPRLVAMLDIQRAKLQTLLASTTALAATANSVFSQANTAQLVADAGQVVSALGSYNDRLKDTLSTMTTLLTRVDASIHGDYMVFDGALDIPGTIDKLLTGGLLVNGTPINGQDALDGFLSGGLR
jgi:phospholipid/cholesterol/gamma-HCH transport system substrate-binding protein